MGPRRASRGLLKLVTHRCTSPRSVTHAPATTELRSRLHAAAAGTPWQRRCGLLGSGSPGAPLSGFQAWQTLAAAASASAAAVAPCAQEREQIRGRSSDSSEALPAAAPRRQEQGRSRQGKWDEGDEGEWRRSSRWDEGEWRSSSRWLFLALPPLALGPALALSAQAQQAEPSEEPDTGTLPVYRASEVAKHSTPETGMWVTYGDSVYDISKFVTNHPGGQDKIMLAAGGELEPYWDIYRQHQSPLAQEILAKLKIGHLHPDDVQARQEAARKRRERGEDESDPYAFDPTLSPLLRFHRTQPINAEPPGALLTDAWITPVDLWYVRNHHPVVHVRSPSSPSASSSPEEEEAAVEDAMRQFQVDLVSAPLLSCGETSLLKWSAHDLKQKFPAHSVVVTTQCAGNRRGEMTRLEQTNGSSWDVGAVSTAKWTGVRLRDLLAFAGITEESVFGNLEGEEPQLKHVHFVGADGVEVSIPIKKALGRFDDVLLAYEMNGRPLPPKHGFPLRVVVPGYVGVRHVKWLSKIRVSQEEAPGPWQRGMAYKGFGPSVKSLEGIDVEAIPSLQEQPVTSTITVPFQGATLQAGDWNTIKGFAYSGGGRAIIRVDVSVDGGSTWGTATLLDGAEQPLDRAWAWTFWEFNVEVPAEKAGTKVEVICKATDASYNVQPDSVAGIWNLRGINNNAWHRVLVDAVAPPPEEEDEDM